MKPSPFPPAESIGGGTELGRTHPDGHVNLEEVMERLADELEAEFARTYGSSGD